MKGKLLIFLAIVLLSTSLCAKEITFWFAGGDPTLDLPVVQRQVEEFEKETGIKVKLSTYALRVNKARKKEVDRRIASGRASS